MTAPPVTLKTGDYVITRQNDDAGRADGVETLKRNGCRDWRFEPRDNGTVTVHGFLRDGNAKHLEQQYG